ncbi:hypothetical protein BESB_037870 [Besnoitia besnoiti]|uniref:Uncharacterized protein n=1 Tax=Besnoitia besnoiti TaxID=94643 RepID=A0A2A9MHF5_BESBE|nr:hypothetical protein BESB_037870 [Besnoitia besnoiti]PFH37329.1 hypothetical protein BESB_037870 [Besnoitia besnoiti]
METISVVPAPDAVVMNPRLRNPQSGREQHTTNGTGSVLNSSADGPSPARFDAAGYVGQIPQPLCLAGTGDSEACVVLSSAIGFSWLIPPLFLSGP